MDMQQHIRELRAMRLECREEGHTHASLAERFQCDKQSIFDILEGKTKEGVLRDAVHSFLTQPNEANPPAPVEQSPADFAKQEGARLRAAWKTSGLTQGEIAEKVRCSAASLALIFKGQSHKGKLYARVCDFLLNPTSAKATEAELPPPNPPCPERSAIVAPPAPRPADLIPSCNVGDVELLQAQAMACEELAEALKDLALLRQAASRYAAAVSIARSVGLRIA